MKTVLAATDSTELFLSIDAALGSDTTQVIGIRTGQAVNEAVIKKDPDIVLLDLQIGNMGGIAACIALRQEEGAGRLQKRPIMLLLDRADDEYLASTSGADSWLVKPFKASELNDMVGDLISQQGD